MENMIVSDKIIRMLNVLKAQVTNLDSSKYKVMLVWDPDNARDVGWLTVEKDMKVDLEALQVRDVNLNKINLSPKSESEPSNPNNESERCFVNCNINPHIGESNQEVIVIEDDAIEDSVHKAKHMKVNMVNDVDHIRKGKVQCPECKIILYKNNFPRHMTKIHGKFVKTEKVKCEICSIDVNKVNLEFHMKLKHSNSNKCVDCGKTLKSYKGLRSHRRWCTKARNNDSKIDGSTAENDIPDRNASEKEVGVVKINKDSDMIKPAESERVDFSILHEGRSYSCSRSRGVPIKGSLKKFCKHVGKDLKFEFEGRFLTGAEIVDTFSGGKILAKSATHVNN